MKNKKILEEINSYYTDKIIKNGPTPQGVDWNSTESQFLRFNVLSDVINKTEPFSILDFGCGYGSMFEYYKKKYTDFKYIGFDISEEMINQAKKIHSSESNVNWIDKIDFMTKVDYTVASGIFNVRLNNNDKEWKEYVIETLKKINEISELGFSFNMLTKYSDTEYMKDYLYYADPLFIFDYCKKNFSKLVALKHDYPLYEFTIIVRK